MDVDSGRRIHPFVQRRAFAVRRHHAFAARARARARARSSPGARSRTRRSTCSRGCCSTRARRRPTTCSPVAAAARSTCAAASRTRACSTPPMALIAVRARSRATRLSRPGRADSRGRCSALPRNSSFSRRCPPTRSRRRATRTRSAWMLDAARATCDFYIDTAACADGMPYWDTGAPGLLTLGDWGSAGPPIHSTIASRSTVLRPQSRRRVCCGSAGFWATRGDGWRRYWQAGLRVADTLFDPAGPYLSQVRVASGAACCTPSITGRTAGTTSLPARTCRAASRASGATTTRVRSRCISRVWRSDQPYLDILRSIAHHMPDRELAQRAGESRASRGAHHRRHAGHRSRHRTIARARRLGSAAERAAQRRRRRSRCCDELQRTWRPRRLHRRRHRASRRQGRDRRPRAAQVTAPSTRSSTTPAAHRACEPTSSTRPRRASKKCCARTCRVRTSSLRRSPATCSSALASDATFRAAIVFVTSVSAQMISTNRGEYCISKAGLAMAASLFAVRLAPHGIPVYDVRPGVIATDMTSAVKEMYDRRIADGLVPEARWGQPDDVGRRCVRSATRRSALRDRQRHSSSTAASRCRGCNPLRDPRSGGRGTEVPRYGCLSQIRTLVARNFSSAKLESSIMINRAPPSIRLGCSDSAARAATQRLSRAASRQRRALHRRVARRTTAACDADDGRARRCSRSTISRGCSTWSVREDTAAGGLTVTAGTETIVLSPVRAWRR